MLSYSFMSFKNENKNFMKVSKIGIELFRKLREIFVNISQRNISSRISTRGTVCSANTSEFPAENISELPAGGEKSKTEEPVLF